MKVSGKNYRTIWLKEGDEEAVSIIDQRYLPHKFVIEHIHSTIEMVNAIQQMHVRGAGLIGAAAGYGMYLAALEARETDSFQQSIEQSAKLLVESRPTAANLAWAVNRQLRAIALAGSVEQKIKTAKTTAGQIADEDAAFCKSIGEHGVKIIEEIAAGKNAGAVNILTHCNAGWLAFVDYGSALSPVYEAHARNIKLHVWVSETRPRNQGANLTAWELQNQQVPHTVIADNTAGHLMQQGLVDVVLTGADRVTSNGDAANKIGTYLKALAAMDNHIPFYVAFPSSTFDHSMADGTKQMVIEERHGDEVKYVYGFHEDEIKQVLITPADSPAINFGFDVTPARLITGFITERGICKASEEDIHRLFPEER